MAGFAYGGSKAAVVHTMKQFATKLTPYGIRCNVIAPGCKFDLSWNIIVMVTVSNITWIFIGFEIYVSLR
jgi:NAD(P)-dependent dehydrogenase (short-subunit alcohol dehydrogenase family)